MGRLLVFNQISLDGFFVDGNGDMNWAHQDDAEWNAFVADNASGGALLILGRVTYELMAGFWPTPAAMESMPVLAERMNNLPKVVFSKTLNNASWANTRVVRTDLAAEVRKIKGESEKHATILGSGSIVSQLAQERLIDEYQIVVNPIALGSGRTLFDGVSRPLRLTLSGTRRFSNGNVLLCYQLGA